MIDGRCLDVHGFLMEAQERSAKEASLSRAPRVQHWCDGQAGRRDEQENIRSCLVRWCEHGSDTESAEQNSTSRGHDGGNIQREVRALSKQKSDS